MLPYQKILALLLLYTQGIAAAAGIVSFRKFRDTTMKYFVFFLMLILAMELFSKYGLQSRSSWRQDYYAWIVIPFQFFFWFWLYSKSDPDKKKYYWYAAVFYLLLLLFESVFLQYGFWSFLSLSYSVANIFLAVMVLRQFNIMLHSERILEFRKDIWFYINAGVAIFYIGTLPFFAFYRVLVKDIEVWRGYYTFFILSDHLMYLLFSIGLICSREKQ